MVCIRGYPTSWDMTCSGDFNLTFTVLRILCIRYCPGGGGELPYEEYTGVCHELGSHFQEKIPKRVCKFFTKIPERAIISVRNSR